MYRSLAIITALWCLPTLALPQSSYFQLLSPTEPAPSELRAMPADSMQEWIAVFSDDIAYRSVADGQFESDLVRIIQSMYGTGKMGANRVVRLELIRGAAFTAPARLLPSLSRLPYVRYIERNLAVQMHPVPKTAPGSHLRDLIMGAPSTTGGKGVRIAIIDTGVDYTHPDLGGCFGVDCRVVGGYDTVDDDPDPFDENGHGTHVAGIAAGTGLSAGRAPESQILAYRALNASGSGTFASTIAAIERAVSDGAHIINMSLGAAGAPPDNPLNAAVREAVRRGVLVVASAGNSGPQWGTIGSPGNEALALTVGAVDDAGRVASFSSRGPVESTFVLKPDLSAPGVSILSAVPGGGHLRLSGTSMAAPYVAGLAARLKEAYPGAEVLALRSMIIQSATPLNQPLWHVGSGKAKDNTHHYRRSAAHPTSISVMVRQAEGDEFQTLDTTVTLWNMEPSPKRVSLRSDSPSGVVISTAQQAVVPGLGTLELPIRIQWDPQRIPYPQEVPPVFWGSIQITSDADTLLVPLLIARPSEIQMEFESPPDLVILHDRRGTYAMKGSSSRNVSFRTGAGVFDVWALRDADATKWILEGVQVEGLTKLKVLETDARNTLRYELSDPDGKAAGACGYSREFFRHKPSGLGLVYQYERSCPEMSTLVIQNQISNISSDMEYEVSHIAYGSATGYEYLRFPFRFESGITENRLLRAGGGDFRSIRWAYHLPSGVRRASFTKYYESPGGSAFNPPSWLKRILEEPWRRTESVLPNPTARFVPFGRSYDKLFAMESDQFDPDQDTLLLVTPSVEVVHADTLALSVAETRKLAEWAIPLGTEPIVIGTGPDSWSPGAVTEVDGELLVPARNAWFVGWSRELRTGMLHMEVTDAEGAVLLSREVQNGIPNPGSLRSDDWISLPKGEGYTLTLTRAETWLGTREQTTTTHVALDRASMDLSYDCFARVAFLDARQQPVQKADLPSAVRLVIESRNCAEQPRVSLRAWESQELTALAGSEADEHGVRRTVYSIPDRLNAGYYDLLLSLGDTTRPIFEHLVSPALALKGHQPLADPPPPPTLLTPKAREFIFSDRVELRWDEVSGATGYRVQVSLDGNFAALSFDSLTIGVSMPVRVYGYGLRWYWRVAAENGEGWGPWSSRGSFVTAIEGTHVHEEEVQPMSWHLHQNYPNPFNPSTSVSIDVASSERVVLELFSLTGQRVFVSDLGVLQPGRHTVPLHLGQLSSGLYVYQVRSKSFRQSRKMTLIQ